MVIPIQSIIPCFQGSGYDIWSSKMRTLFISEDLWELVDMGYIEEEISKNAIRDVRKKDAKALFLIQQAIAENIFPQISKATKSKEAWDALQIEYQRTTKVATQDGDGSQTNIKTMVDIVYEAAAMGDIKILEEIPESEFEVQLSPKHNTILHIASEFGQTDCVKWILELPSCSSLLQRPNMNGDTPLHLAAREGHLEVVEALINTAKQLPLDIETKTSSEKVMLRMTNKGKDTALHEAVRYWHSDVVKLLIEEDPDFSYGANDSEITKMILGWKSDLTKQVDENGWSPLHCGAERGCDPTIVGELLNIDKSVAYLTIKDGNKTALHIASFHHHTKIVEEIVSHSPGCREQVDDKGNNAFHFAMMKKGDDDYYIHSYFRNKWLRTRGLVNEKDAQGNTPLHLLSCYQIRDVGLLWRHQVDKKAYNNEKLTAYDMTLRAKENVSAKRIQEQFEWAMPGNTSMAMEKSMKKLKKETESKEYKEKYTSELRKQGETHLIVSALITTVTFAAGFTLPGGYKEDDGKAILSKKAAFGAFVVTDTIAMVSSLCAVFLHFFMTMRKDDEFLEKHLLWAFIFTMVGMGAMAIAFATGLYVVLPHSSGLSFLSCILCSCFFLSFVVEYCQFWRGTISDMVDKITSSLKKKKE
ncbi:ankyrin repeat-containing protein NPR4 isoform X2 [Vitis vinifera]|uniref:ankyrin repeat-containing protein NPR4 isoform X2 n=1 Tax=Vitis vinifera TaxID=29760 RepID=UPI0028830174|nr:ankyrin repeat-containing protein NPR4 isoform X2 [Vitis vinifera]